MPGSKKKGELSEKKKFIESQEDPRATILRSINVSRKSRGLPTIPVAANFHRVVTDEERAKRLKSRMDRKKPRGGGRY